MTAIYEAPNANQTRAAFFSALESQGLRYRIGWRWNRRSRDGVITVEDGDERTVAEMHYVRNTQRWSVTDSHLSRLRTDSAKHLALLALVAELQRPA